MSGAALDNLCGFATRRSPGLLPGRAAHPDGGGRAQLIDAPAIGAEGHALFDGDIWFWTTMVDDFLHGQNLGTRDLLPFTIPDLPPPPLGQRVRAAFADDLSADPHKAFSASSTCGFGYSAGRRSSTSARAEGLAVCARYAQDCTLYAIDNALAETGNLNRQA